MKQFSREAEGRPTGAVELWRRHRGVQINRPNIQESEQTITTQGQIIGSCSKILIFLFNLTILQGDCHRVEAFFKFERRIKETQPQRDSFTTRDQHLVAPYLFTNQDSFFCVSNLCLIAFIDHFSQQPDRKVGLRLDFFGFGRRLSFLFESAIKIS